jgi:hypothetical protein
MTDSYEAAIKALRLMSPDWRILALHESVIRDREAEMQAREQLEFPEYRVHVDK